LIKENSKSYPIVYSSEKEPFNFLKSEISELDRQSILSNKNYKDVLLEEYKLFSENNLITEEVSNIKSMIKNFLYESKNKKINFDDLDDGINILKQIKSKIDDNQIEIEICNKISSFSCDFENIKCKKTETLKDFNFIKAINRVIPDDVIPKEILSNLINKFKESIFCKNEKSGVENTEIRFKNKNVFEENDNTQSSNIEQNKILDILTNENSVNYYKKIADPHTKGYKAKRNYYPERKSKENDNIQLAHKKADIKEFNSSNFEPKLDETFLKGIHPNDKLFLGNKKCSTDSLADSFNYIKDKSNKMVTNNVRNTKKMSKFLKDGREPEAKEYNNNTIGSFLQTIKNSNNKIVDNLKSELPTPKLVEAIPNLKITRPIKTNKILFDFNNTNSNSIDKFNNYGNRFNSGEILNLVEDVKISMPEDFSVTNLNVNNNILNNPAVIGSPINSNASKLTINNPMITSKKIEPFETQRQSHPNFINVLNFFNNQNNETNNSIYIDNQFGVRTPGNNISLLNMNNIIGSPISNLPNNFNNLI